MEYRFKRKEKRTTSTVRRLLDRFKFRKYEVGGEVYRKKITVLAVSIIIVFSIFVVSSNMTGFFFYAEDIKTKLNQTTEERNLALAEKEDCENKLFSCAENLDVCASGLSDCSSVKDDCLVDRDNCRTKFDDLNNKYNVCVDDRGLYKTGFDECSTNLSELRNDFDQLSFSSSGMKTNYRNLACCVSKLGQTGVSKMYWKMVDNKIVCQISPVDGSAEIAVSELGC